MKSEPEVFSLQDLEQAPGRKTLWEGVRNYQARNLMRDRMHQGDPVLYYHSRCLNPGVVGLAAIVSESAYADPSQFDPDSDYFDPKATRQHPRWLAVDLGFREQFVRPVTLAEIKANPELSSMLVARRGNRLSITPVDAQHFDRICALGRSAA